MASLIKNQILKHLSKFTKNLSADKINVSTLKGEGELYNLELNEEVLMDVLELPLWIRLTKAICNRVSCKIVWTKLKSVPICLNLDEVLVEMETCEELRKQKSQTSLPSYSSGGKYGFYDKVIDGMTVKVNNIVINFKSPAFHASFQLSRICLDSRMPTWQVSDLRMTRLKEPEREELLIFKQLHWQTLRVEAMATSLQEQFSTPLRLITYQACCRITIKKRISDCSILGSRLVLILDNLLWVLTDAQLKAALHFANSLSGLIQRSTELSQKTKAVRKLESQPSSPLQSSVVGQSQRRPSYSSHHQMSALARMFNVHDVLETSYHLYSTQINLHLCDEVGPSDLHSSHPRLSEGGVMQVTFSNLAVDYYPYHLACGDRKQWIRYKESSTSRSTWVASLLASFRHRVMEVIQGEVSRIHMPVHRVPPQAPLVPEQRKSTTGAPGIKSALGIYMARLMSMCVVVRMDDFCIFHVSTAGSLKGTPGKLISSDKSRLLLPSDMTAIHIEWTQYYYPGDGDISVPLPYLYIHLNPFQVSYEPVTILWVNSFILNLQKTQEMLNQFQGTQAPMIDIRIESLLPRILISEENEHVNQPDRPKQLQIQVSRLVVTNSRIGEQCGRIELGKCLEVIQEGELFFGSSFPSAPDDYLPVVKAFVQHSLSKDRIVLPNVSEDSKGHDRPSTRNHIDNVKELFGKVPKSLLWTEFKNIWCINMDPIWADFLGVDANKQRPVPFMDAFPLTLWIYRKQHIYDKPPFERSNSKLLFGIKENNTEFSASKQENKRLKEANLHVLAHVQALVNVQMNHYQYIFLLRLIESFAEFNKQLIIDTSVISNKAVFEVSSSCLAAFFPELHISFVMPVSKTNFLEKAVNSVDLDENISVRSSDSIPTDVPTSPIMSKMSHLPFDGIMVKESVSEHTVLKDISDRDVSLNGSITKSVSDSLLDVHSVHNSSPNNSGGLSPSLAKSQEMASGRKNIRQEDKDSMTSGISDPLAADSQVASTSNGSHSTTPSVPPDWVNLDKMPDNVTRTFKSGSNMMKKGFSNFMSSIDSAISRNPTQGVPDRIGSSPDELPLGMDEWETMSIRSDMSSDSDQFLIVQLENQPNRLEDTLFNIQDIGPCKVERASEVKEDSPSEPSSASIKRLDLVSALTLRFGKVEYLQQSEGTMSAVCIQCSQLTSEEYGHVTWDEFQTKFSASSRNWQESLNNFSVKPCELKVRMESKYEEMQSLEVEPMNRITGIVRNLSLTLAMSSVVGLSDLIEDEVILIPTPLQVLLENIKLELKEDRSSNNMTTSGPIPLGVFIAGMTVHRDIDGIYRFQAIDDSTIAQYYSSFSSSPSTADIRSVLAKCFPKFKSNNEELFTDVYEKPSAGSVSTLNTSSTENEEKNDKPHSKDLDSKTWMDSNVLEILMAENTQLKERLNEAVTRADCALERLAEVEDEILHLREEKQSLLATRQVLQQELMALEMQRRNLGSQFSEHNATG